MDGGATDGAGLVFAVTNQDILEKETAFLAKKAGLIESAAFVEAGLEAAVDGLVQTIDFSRGKRMDSAQGVQPGMVI